MKRLICGSLLMVVLLGITPTAQAVPATVWTESFEEFWTSTFQPDCFAEEITLSGRVLIRQRIIDDGAGGRHISSTWTGTGISATGTTGTKYRVALASAAAGNEMTWLVDGVPATYMSVSTYRIVAPGGVSLISYVRLHQTITPDGDVVVSIDATEWQCV